MEKTALIKKIVTQIISIAENEEEIEYIFNFLKLEQNLKLVLEVFRKLSSSQSIIDYPELQTLNSRKLDAIDLDAINQLVKVLKTQKNITRNMILSSIKRVGKVRIINEKSSVQKMLASTLLELNSNQRQKVYLSINY
jgi:hypothetical protein